MKLTNIAIVLVAASYCVSLPIFANTPSDYLTKENMSMNQIDEYWTPERMKNAQAEPIPTVDTRVVQELDKKTLDAQQHLAKEFGMGAAPSIQLDNIGIQLYKPDAKSLSNTSPADRGTSKEEFSSSRLVPLSADLSYPYSTVGKLFFTKPGVGDFVCSASVLRPRVLVTAGHCVHKGSSGSEGFFTNFKFVPAFRDGAAPYQTWNWSYVIVTGTWATGGGGVPNAADYAMFEMRDNNIAGFQRKIGSITGYLGYQTLSLMPNHAHLLGYPCNLDSCQKMHQVTAQSAKSVSPNNVEYGSDMAGGSSGGPWVQNFGTYALGQTGGQNSGLNRVIGITSYLYTNGTALAEGSSIPDSRFISILNTVCAHRAGNC